MNSSTSAMRSSSMVVVKRCIRILRRRPSRYDEFSLTSYCWSTIGFNIRQARPVAQCLIRGCGRRSQKRRRAFCRSRGGCCVSKWLRVIASGVLIVPVFQQAASAETRSVSGASAEAANSQAGPQALPPLMVQAPPQSQKPHRASKRNARMPRSTASVAAAARTAEPVVSASGAPNIGSGPSGPPNMASQTSVSGEDLNARPVTRPGEVLEAVPGLIVTQHSGEGKANQYFLRGYNLDHGTDMAIFVDDV